MVCGGSQDPVKEPDAGTVFDALLWRERRAWNRSTKTALKGELADYRRVFKDVPLVDHDWPSSHDLQ